MISLCTVPLENTGEYTVSDDNSLSPIAAARVGAGMTRLTLSRITGIPVRSITYWESGLRKPHMENLIKLSLTLGINYKQLL